MFRYPNEAGAFELLSLRLDFFAETNLIYRFDMEINRKAPEALPSVPGNKPGGNDIGERLKDRSPPSVSQVKRELLDIDAKSSGAPARPAVSVAVAAGAAAPPAPGVPARPAVSVAVAAAAAAPPAPAVPPRPAVSAAVAAAAAAPPAPAVPARPAAAPPPPTATATPAPAQPTAAPGPAPAPAPARPTAAPMGQPAAPAQARGTAVVTGGPGTTQSSVSKYIWTNQAEIAKIYDQRKVQREKSDFTEKWAPGGAADVGAEIWEGLEEEKKESAKIGVMVAANSGMPGGKLGKPDHKFDKSDLGENGQEESVVANYLETAAPGDSEAKKKLFNEKLKHQWGFEKVTDSTETLTKQGVDFKKKAKKGEEPKNITKLTFSKKAN